jgi:hypothetical protein
MNIDYLMNHKSRTTAYMMCLGIILITLFAVSLSWYFLIPAALVQIPIFIIFLKRYGEINPKHTVNVFVACILILLIEAILAIPTTAIGYLLIMII